MNPVGSVERHGTPVQGTGLRVCNRADTRDTRLSGPAGRLAAAGPGQPGAVGAVRPTGKGEPGRESGQGWPATLQRIALNLSKSVPPLVYMWLALRR
jgi:hypothetical protein